MKVTLKFPHTHAGVAYAAGTEIDVAPIEAIWLKGEDLIHTAWNAIEAEAKKLATPTTPKPYAAELAAAQTRNPGTDAAPSKSAADAAATQEPTK
ncbi:MAG: DUF7210 family protein [Rhodanobacter sp.]